MTAARRANRGKREAYDRILHPGPAAAGHDAQDGPGRLARRPGAHARRGASFSTIFALAPLFVIIMALTGHFVSSAVVEQHLVNQVSHAVGSDAASALRAMVDASHANAQAGSIVGAIGWVVLLGAAAGIFLTLQDALNIIWHVDVPKNQPLTAVLGARAAALAMVFAMAVLIVLTLAVDALLAVGLTYLEGGATSGPLVLVGQVAGTLFTVAATTAIFAMAFKVLPQTRVGWHDVWPGAAHVRGAVRGRAVGHRALPRARRLAERLRRGRLGARAAHVGLRLGDGAVLRRGDH